MIMGSFDRTATETTHDHGVAGSALVSPAQRLTRDATIALVG
jgi:hypothetical protein